MARKKKTLEPEKEIGDSGSIESAKGELEEIKEDVQEIMEEVSDSSRDVDELREDVEEIKEDISEMTKATAGFKSMMEKIGHKLHIHIPSKFSFSDIAQQMVGAIILSTPFSVTSEVWELSKNLDIYRVLLIIILTICIDILLIYFTKFQNIDLTNLFSVFARITSLIIISYTAAALILYLFGVIGNQVTDFWWAVRLVILVGMFANIGAGTADLLK